MGKPSPQWVRETLCEDLAEVDRKSGRLPDTRLIEEVVSGDIQDFEAHQREAKPTRHSKDKGSRKLLTKDGLDKANPAQDLAQKLGYELVTRPVSQSQPASKPCACGGICKNCKLKARVQELCKLRFKGKGEARKLDFAYPMYGPLLVNEAHAASHGKGPYKGMSRANVNRKLRRFMENIADQSNGHPGLGAWWVK